MAENKRSFLLYCDLVHTVDKLPDDKAGILFKHILSYVNDKNPETDDIIIQISFEPIKQQLKRDLKKYQSIVERNRENGLKGGRPKNPEEPKKPSGLSGNPKEPKKADNDNGSGSGSGSENDIDKKERELFDLGRKIYGGTKRGNDTEFENFKKKHKDYKKILPLLEPAVEAQIKWRDTKEFRPEWKNFQTWINQRCWEDELSVSNSTKGFTYKEAMMEDPSGDWTKKEDGLFYK